MASPLDKELMHYFIRLNEPQKKSLLEMMRSFLKPEDVSSERITVKQYNSELDEAMKRIDDGAFTTLEELEREMESW